MLLIYIYQVNEEKKKMVINSIFYCDRFVQKMVSLFFQSHDIYNAKCFASV